MAAAAWVDRWPVLGRHERAAEWLGVWADLGRAPGTIDAYARGLAEYLQACERDGVDPLAAGRAQVAAFVRELAGRADLRGANVVSIDPGRGWRTRRCSSDWSRSGCSMSSWWRRGPRVQPGRPWRLHAAGWVRRREAGAGAPDDPVAVDSR